MKLINILIAALLLTGCAKAQRAPVSVTKKPIRSMQHNYGGWYCPDNLIGFPAVNVQDWDKVPVIEGRLPSEEEARSGQSLIFVDRVEFPDAYAIDVKLPQLAYYQSPYSKQIELVIVIQAINVRGDDIVGFRYLNGGNGSAYLDEVTFLSKDEVTNLKPYQFVGLELEINATEDKVWEVITDIKYKGDFEPILNKNGNLHVDWRAKSNFNYFYNKRNIPASSYKEKLFGNWYIQNDYNILGDGYVEKVLILKDEASRVTKLKVLFGPYLEDYNEQEDIINAWSNEVKALSEK